MRSKKVIINSIIYTGSNILLKAFNFFLLPLYTTYLTTSDYGITNLAASFQIFASFLVAFCLYSAVIRFYPDYRDDQETLQEYFGTIICFIFISASCFLCFFFFCRDLLVRLIFSDITFFPTVVIILISLMFYCLYTVYQEILKGMQYSLKSAIINISYFFVQFSLNIYFIVFFKAGAYGVLLANLIANFLFAGWAIIDLIYHKLFKFCINISMLKSSLKYSIPLLPHYLSAQIAQFVSKIFININNNLSAVGIFAIASQFGHIADLASASFHMAFQPWFFEKMGSLNNSIKKEIIQLTNAIMWVFGLGFICLSSFSQEAILLMTGPDYHPAWKLVPLFVLTYLIKIPYYFYLTILLYYKEATRKIFYATLSTNILNVFLSYFFIPLWGSYGSVIADVIAMILRVLTLVCLCKNYNEVEYDIKWLMVKTMVVALFIFSSQLLSLYIYPYRISVTNISYKLLLIILYMALVYRLNRRTFLSIYDDLRIKIRKRDES